MALSRVTNYHNFTLHTRPIFNGNATIKLLPTGTINHLNERKSKGFHVTKVGQYPEAPTLRLPTNVSEIFTNETGRFTQERIRDIYSNETQFSNKWKEAKSDLHIASYDCFGAVSLNSSMQTNVPKPFNSTGKSNYLNMPGGQWARDGKYIAEDMQKSHYKCQLLKLYKKNGFIKNPVVLNYQLRNYSTNAPESKSQETESQKAPGPVLTKKERFQILVKDYGKTIIVFHITLSLMTLGGCYMAVSSGFDMTKIVSAVAENNNELINKVMTSGSTFAVAYAIHKLFAPMRLMMTMAFAPILVNFLRRKGILRHPELVKKIKEARKA